MNGLSFWGKKGSRTFNQHGKFGKNFLPMRKIKTGVLPDGLLATLGNGIGSNGPDILNGKTLVYMG